MLRVLVLLLALTSVARADEASEGREIANAALARYKERVDSRNILARLYDLSGNSEWTNLQNSGKALEETRADLEKAIQSNSVYEIHARLGDVKRDAKDVDRKIDEYTSASRGMVLKLGAGLGIIAIAIFGGGILAFVRRRRRR